MLSAGSETGSEVGISVFGAGVCGQDRVLYSQIAHFFLITLLRKRKTSS